MGSTCVTVNVKAIYAPTEREVIQAKGAPNLYASIPDTIDIWKIHINLRDKKKRVNPTKKEASGQTSFTSRMVGRTLKTIAERIKLIARLPRSIILFKPPVSRLNVSK